MPHTSAPGQRAGALAAVSGPAAARRRTSFDQLRRLSDRLDQLMLQVSCGARNQREHDRHVEEAEAIADGLRDVFRKPTAAQHPPIWRRGGRAVW